MQFMQYVTHKKYIDLICLLYRSCDFIMRSEDAYGSKEGLSLLFLLWSYNDFNALFKTPSAMNARLVKSFCLLTSFIFFTFQSAYHCALNI